MNHLVDAGDSITNHAFGSVGGEAKHPDVALNGTMGEGIVGEAINTYYWLITGFWALLR